MVLGTKHRQQQAEEQYYKAKPDHDYKSTFSNFLDFKCLLIQKNHASNIKSIKNNDNVSFSDKLSLATSMDVTHLSSLWISMSVRRPSDVIPHLARGHGKNYKQASNGPVGLIIKEF
mmetsp:Transcript_23166/g.37731  ORF Transcript_23166/g.37731 Transcript_23166/m.37731 type:complete len:117 (-) Transcript_23166:556-906(-)